MSGRKAPTVKPSNLRKPKPPPCPSEPNEPEVSLIPYSWVEEIRQRWHEWHETNRQINNTTSMERVNHEMGDKE